MKKGFNPESFRGKEAKTQSGGLRAVPRSPRVASQKSYWKTSNGWAVILTERRSATGLCVIGCGCYHTSQEHHMGRMFPAAKPIADRCSGRAEFPKGINF